MNGITFCPFAPRGSFKGAAAKESLQAMKERTGADTVVFAPAGLQETPQSVDICYTGEHTVTDEELCDMIMFAKSMDLRVFLKPTVNCLNGVWRAFINFFDEDVPCEPKWSDWFRSHTQFQLHYAEIAEKTGCDMFITGCEMVMAERREEEWRELIGKVKSVYHGPVSYNTDKYQEDHVKWWDCVDVISSSGYYPADDWEGQLDRIEQVVKKYQKPFFFAETGCMSTAGSSMIPNNWGLEGVVDLQEQKNWYEKAFAAMDGRDWIRGVVLWSWPGKLYTEQEALQHRYYEFYRKPAETVIRSHFMKHQ